MRYLGPLAWLAALMFQPAAAVAQAPTETLELDSQVVLTADSILVDDAANTVTAIGNVEAVYQGRVMRADRLVYNRVSDTVRATGNIVILDPDGTQRFADEIETDANLSDGYAVGFATRMPNGGLATAQSAVRSPDGSNALDKVVYTSCQMCEDDTTPTWSLRARRAVLDESSQMYSYTDTVLEVAGIPVLYLPYFSHPDPDSERRSGFLAPDFGTSSKLGLFYQQPYYWAISPSQDLTIAPKIMANVNPLLEMDYRKRFWSGRTQASFSFTNDRDFDSDGNKFGPSEWRGHFFGSGDFDIAPEWRWGFGIEQVSDDLYTRRYDIEGENERRGLYYGQPLRLLNQVFLQGQSDGWYADASLITLEGLRENDADDTFPSALPLFYAERNLDFGSYGFAKLSGSTAFLTRSSGVDTQRASVAAEWSKTQILPGGTVFSPFAEARFDHYALNDTPSNADSASRGLYTAGARLSYPLIRPGPTVDLLIEPTLMLGLGSSAPNDPDIPVEDSLFYEFDESSLFEANGAAGYDLYEGGQRLSAGLSATARWKNGVSLQAMGGRRWRESGDSAFTKASNLRDKSSDWVGGLSADFGRPLSFETRVRLDKDDLSVNRVDASMTTDWWRLQGQLRYYRISKDITETGLDDEGVAITGQVRVSDEFFLVYARQRDISGRFIGPERQSGRDLRHVFGVAYEDDCSRFEITFERSEAIDRTLGANDSLKFRFSLKTLGDFGPETRS